MPGESASAERADLRSEITGRGPLLLGLEAPLGPLPAPRLLLYPTLLVARGHLWMNEWLHEGMSFSSHDPLLPWKAGPEAPPPAVRAEGRPRDSLVSTPPPHPRAIYLQTLSTRGLSSARAPWTSTECSPTRHHLRVTVRVCHLRGAGPGQDRVWGTPALALSRAPGLLISALQAYL